MAYKQAMDYVDHMCDARILGYYRYHPGVLLLALLSLARQPWIKLKYFSKRVLGRNPITGKAFKKMKVCSPGPDVPGSIVTHIFPLI